MVLHSIVNIRRKQGNLDSLEQNVRACHICSVSVRSMPFGPHLSCVSGWIQHREVGAPKEFHYDSALTWCRKNGWRQDELEHCPFYPQIGSIFYLTAAGGPTGEYAEMSSPHVCMELQCLFV